MIWNFPSRRLLRFLSQSRSYVTTDCQSASLSWNKAPIWGYDQIFITVRQLHVCWCGVFCLSRGRVCRLQLLLALASAVILGSESRLTRDHILLSQIRDFPLRRLLTVENIFQWRISDAQKRKMRLEIITSLSTGLLYLSYMFPCHHIYRKKLW
jgi:hypothetical protein